jgi:hypothetical protein
LRTEGVRFTHKIDDVRGNPDDRNINSGYSAGVPEYEKE